jgi:hypothetical protein
MAEPVVDGPLDTSERLRPERGAESPRESERGWGPASTEKWRIV